MTETKMIQNGSEARFVLGGDLIASAVDEARALMKQALQDGVTDFVVDFQNVRMIDSMGIGSLVAMHNSMTKIGGKLMIVNVSEEIFELLQSMRLDRHFVITRSV
jgi:serine/threonine-protein kinase RsbW